MRVRRTNIDFSEVRKLQYMRETRGKPSGKTIIKIKNIPYAVGTYLINLRDNPLNSQKKEVLLGFKVW